MGFTKEHRPEIEEAVAITKCQFDFECIKSEFENLCEVGIELDGEVLWCIECFDDNEKIGCNNRLSYGYGYLCECPLRQYIARTLHK